MRLYYEDAAVTLYHGDALEVTEWLKADVLVTDPPYGFGHVRFGTNVPSMRGEAKIPRASDRVLADDTCGLRDSVLARWGTVPALVFGHWRAPMPSGIRLRLIWDKEVRNGAGGLGPWRPGDEEIYLVGNWPNPKAGKRGPVESTVIRCPAPKGLEREGHPTPKPLPLMRHLIQRCPPGVIADPFAGSGSTLAAAKQVGRRAIGVELREDYCEIAARRLSQDALFTEEPA